MNNTFSSQCVTYRRMWQIVSMLRIQGHGRQLQWTYTCKCVLRFDHESLWKTLCDRVRVKVSVRAGMEWTAGASALSVCSCRGRHSVGFNWEHRASYKDAEGCLSRSYETPIQIVGMLHIMKENALPWTMNMVNRFSEVAQITLHETQQKNSCYSCLFHHSPVNQSSHTLNCA